MNETNETTPKKFDMEKLDLVMENERMKLLIKQILQITTTEGQVNEDGKQIMGGDVIDHIVWACKLQGFKRVP